MHPERRVRLSKFLSLILRHRPEEVGLHLDRQGQVGITGLVEALRASGWDDITSGDIEEVVRHDARRFALVEGMIRARYGHSITLEQPGAAVHPPEWLYVGVAVEELDKVREEGLRTGHRQHVHLSETPREALRVLERRSVPATVVTIFARRARDGGIAFYRATERLYLSDQIARDYLYFS